MNFKSFALKAAIAATVLTGPTLAVSPAEALTVGSQLDFGWNVSATSDSIDFNLINGTPGSQDGVGGEDIGGFLVSNKTGSFASLPNTFIGLTIGEIKDIPSLASFEAINNFLFFGTNSPFNFNLTSIAYSGLGRYDLSGVFADNTQATGWISTQLVDGKVNSYSATIIAGNEIPTPALLPGLIGMGVAVLRKRKAEETEQVEAEA